MAHIVRFCCDDETGEVRTYELNDETGEPDLENCHPASQIERNTASVISQIPTHCKFPRHGYFSKTKKFQLLKANIIAGSNPVSHRLLLLPTLMFSPALCAILMIFEIFLHIRCHKKNKTLNNPNMFYRSPFHIITSMFCGVCRDSDAASKIGQLQDKRRIRYDYIRGMAI